jgi:hypothetical protein
MFIFMRLGHCFVWFKGESVLFIGTQYSNLYTAVQGFGSRVYWGLGFRFLETMSLLGCYMIFFKRRFGCRGFRCDVRGLVICVLSVLKCFHRWKLHQPNTKHPQSKI